MGGALIGDRVKGDGRLEISRLRDGLAVALDRDVGELPFIAELVQVVPDEQKWTGAVERLLRPFALSVLVPSKLAQKAEAFLHENDLGDRIAFVCPKSDAKQPKLHDDSVVAKLTLRIELDESRQNWLRAELADRFPHLCRDEPDKEFHKMPHALALSGLVKTDGVLREKDDRFPVDDASRHILGWDVDPKQRSLDERLAFLRERSGEAARAVGEADSERADLRLKLKAGAQLVSSAGEFSDVDRLVRGRHYIIRVFQELQKPLLDAPSFYFPSSFLEKTRLSTITGSYALVACFPPS